MQLAFECNTALYREGFHGRETDVAQHFCKGQFSPYFHKKPASMSDSAVIAQIDVWNMMVQELVFRSFTHPIDRFAGISGTAYALESPKLGAYFAGVWETNPFLSMFWYTRYPQDPSSKYRSPSWSWEWTMSQLIWPPGPTSCSGRDYNLALSVGEEEAWSDWNCRFAPKMVDRDVRLETSQTKGRVLEGTSITVTGFCLEIFVEESTSIGYNDWNYENITLGIFVLVDRSPNKCGYRAWLSSDDGTQGDRSKAEKYVCVQILRDRKPRGEPKVYALILEEDPKDKAAYRRLGLVVFDFFEADEKFWDKKTLKLV